MTAAATMNPKKMKVSELRAALESRGLSSNGLKSELIQRLELALDEEEFGSAAQEAQDEALAPPSPKKPTDVKKPTEKAKKEQPAPVAEPKAASPVKAAAASQPVKKETKPVVAAAVKVAAVKAESPAQDPVQDAPSVASPVSKPQTEEEKRAARAAKFGIPLSLEDKKVCWTLCARAT